jgi:hypothetical protein
MVENEKMREKIIKVKDGGFSAATFIFDTAGKVTEQYNLESKKLGQGTYGTYPKS